jgi:hypothetical protein
MTIREIAMFAGPDAPVIATGITPPAVDLPTVEMPDNSVTDTLPAPSTGLPGSAPAAEKYSPALLACCILAENVPALPLLQNSIAESRLGMIVHIGRTDLSDTAILDWRERVASSEWAFRWAAASRAVTEYRIDLADGETIPDLNAFDELRTANKTIAVSVSLPTTPADAQPPLPHHQGFRWSALNLARLGAAGSQGAPGLPFSRRGRATSHNRRYRARRALVEYRPWHRS